MTRPLAKVIITPLFFPSQGGTMDSAQCFFIGAQCGYGQRIRVVCPDAPVRFAHDGQCQFARHERIELAA